MPTVAPPASALPATTLTAALSATPGTGSPAATDALAGLFQSVLAQVVTQTAAAGQQPAVQTNLAGQATTADTDLLAGLLELTGGGEADGEGDDAAVNADLLSQLLAALGGNTQALAQLQQVAPTAETPVGVETVQLLVSARAGTDAALAPAVRQFLDRTGFVGQRPQAATATDTPTASANTPTAAESAAPAAGQTVVTATAATATATATAVPQTVTVADVARTAGRTPAVVVQTAMPQERGQQLPPTAVLDAAPVYPPVTEIQALKAAPAVTPNPSPDALRMPDTDLPVPGTVVQSPAETAAPAFTLPAGASLTVTRAAPQPAQPVAPPVAATLTSTPAAAPAATTVPAAPGITAAVAQPLPTTADPLAGVPGFAQLVSARAAGDDRPDPGTDWTTAVAGPAAQPGEPAPTPAADRPVAQPTQPAPLAEQLTAPILAQVQARPDAGETEVRIRLDPPELGTVKVKIVSTGTDVRAELQVTSEAVRRVVESQLPELRQKLDDAGVRVQRMDVTTDAGGNAGTARDDRGDRQRWQPEPADFRPPPAARPARPATAAGTAPPRGRIDVIA